MKEMFDHMSFGFCIWDVLALVAVLLVAFFMVRRIVRAKRYKRELEAEIASESAAKTVDMK